VAAGVVVNYPAPVVVATCPPVTVVCNPPSGSVFPIGVNVVTCTATDRLGNTATCQFRVTVFRRFVEVDKMPNGTAQLSLRKPDGTTEVVTLAGPTTVEVYFDGEQEGDADDTDNDGLDDVPSRMTEMDLRGNSSMGPVQVTLDPDRPSLGGMEEQANTQSGRLDVMPFAAAGAVDSFFDVFPEIRVGGQLFRPATRLHMASVIRHKPPAPGDTYVNPFLEPIELLDAAGRPTGIFVVREVHTPNPEKEIDVMPFGTAQITLTLPNGGTETVTLAGPTTVEVCIPPDGTAADTDGDGLDQVPTKMTAMDLRGSSSLGPVRATLDPARMTLGEIEEVANGTPGKLDVAPFVPGAAGANSFFDVFTELTVGNLALHPAQSIRMQALIKHKPPGPDDTYVNPFIEPIELLDAAGRPTGIRIVREVHTPNPPKETDYFSYSQGKINLRLPNGQIERVIVAGPTTVEVCIDDRPGAGQGRAADLDGDGLEEVPTEMTQLMLAGNSPLGPVQIMLDPSRPTRGGIEEKVNGTAGVLDLAPFGNRGCANSYFVVHAIIKVGGREYCPRVPLRLEAMICHKPPQPGEAYMNLLNQEPIELLDCATGQPTGIFLTGEMHTPNPPKEIDVFPDSYAEIEISTAAGQRETLIMRGPTTVEVCIDDIPGSPGYGLAADTDADGRDEVPTRMTRFDLTGTSMFFGPVRARLDASRPTLGQIEEQANSTPGTLDTPPFTATGRSDSFFDVFAEFVLADGSVFHTARPLRMQTVITHKPPAPGETYVNPFLEPVELLDANGNPTGVFITREVHTPNPNCTVSINCPTNIVAWTCSPNGLNVDYPAPTATSSCNLRLDVSCVPASGAFFPPGNNPVVCTARDPLGNSASCTFLVRVVQDTTAPQIVCPGDIKVDTCLERERVFYAVTATDDCDTDVTIVCNPPSGSFFPAGTTTVLCRATDDCGHSSECRFQVTVTRLPEPSLTFRRLSDGRVVICWSSPCDNYVLQCTRSLNTPILWETIPGPYPGTAAQHCITNSPNGPHQFYRLKKRGPNEAFEEAGTFPPQGAYLSPSDELTVIPYSVPGAPPRRILARWFVHPVPVPPIVVPRPPPCRTCPPDLFEFRTELDFQASLDDGMTWMDVSMLTDVAVQVGFDPQPDPPSPSSYRMEMLRLDGQPGPIMLGPGSDPFLRLRESPTRQSLGRTTLRQLDDGTFRVHSFFDVFVEVSLDGGQTWAPVQTPVHMELSPRAPTVAEATDALPPAGSYDSPTGHVTRYDNGLLLRRIIHPIPPNPPLPFPTKPNPPCLTCPPATFRFMTDIRFEISTDGGRAWAGIGAEASLSVRTRLGRQVGGMRFFDTEMLQLDVHGGGGIGLPNMFMLRESPSRPSKGMTTIRESPSLSQPYGVDSFFDVFTEISIDGGQTWSQSIEPTHVELQPMMLP
jgi:hypothetical protein